MPNGDWLVDGAVVWPMLCLFSIMILPTNISQDILHFFSWHNSEISFLQ